MILSRAAVRRAAILAVVGTTIGCDQVTKHVASTQLMGMPRQSYLADALRLEYAENPGAFLSLGADFPVWARTALFSVGTAVILITCLALTLRHGWQRRAPVGLGLILAGGLSNLADRVTRGTVVDFLNVGIGPLRTGIFNVADVAIVLGLALLVLRRDRVDRLDEPAAR